MNIAELEGLNNLEFSMFARTFMAIFINDSGILQLYRKKI